MSELTLWTEPLAESNCYLQAEDGGCVVIDPNHPQGPLRVLEERGWSPELILLTHEHCDHTAGLEALRERYPAARVLASAACSSGLASTRLNMSRMMEVYLTFHGKPAHAGACPQDGRNALTAAANATVQMMGISRHSGGMTRINVGQLIAGEGRNVIPSKAVMKLEVRGETGEINQYMVDQVTNICNGVALGFGVTYEMRKMGEAVDLTADQELVDILNAAGRATPGITVVDKALNFGGSEDATILARRVQAHGGKAAFFLWGSDRPSGHHTATFDIKESDLDPALEVWTHIIPSILK